MADKLLEDSAVSVFCESVAMMLDAGIQVDEAVSILGENLEQSSFKKVCDKVYTRLSQGDSLSDAIAASHAFPQYAVGMIAAGEQSGRLENVLRSLAISYDEEARMFAKLRQAIGYPAAMLVLMTVILAFTVGVVIPVFISSYENMSSSLTTASFVSVNAAFVIGWVALAITFVCAVIACIAAVMCSSTEGRQRLINVMEKLPFTRQAMYHLAVSRFTSVLATYVSSGFDIDTSMRLAVDAVTHAELKPKVEKAYESMVDLDNPCGFAEAAYANGIYQGVYARILIIGSLSGNLDETLNELYEAFFDDAIEQIDSVVDSVEPALAAFLTVAVGATLVAVMIPLLGVMGSIK